MFQLSPVGLEMQQLQEGTGSLGHRKGTPGEELDLHGCAHLIWVLGCLWAGMVGGWEGLPRERCAPGALCLVVRSSCKAAPCVFLLAVGGFPT